jgi:hypothetical protein
MSGYTLCVECNYRVVGVLLNPYRRSVYCYDCEAKLSVEEKSKGRTERALDLLEKHYHNEGLDHVPFDELEALYKERQKK